METALQWIVPALIGVVTGAVATAYKSRKDLEVQYDIALRGERIAAYKKLWKQLERLAYYAPEQPLTYGVARVLTKALRTWYFEVGGLLLSESTREPYFDLQRALKAVTESGGEDQLELPEPAADALKQLGSRLRTSTTDDVATRVGPRRVTWLHPDRRFQALVTVTRGWRFDPDAGGVWRVRVLNQSRSRLLRVTRVWLDANGERTVQPLDRDDAVPKTLYPGESWQRFVPDADGLMNGVENPFRAGRASGPGWNAWSVAAGDPPASAIPADTDAEKARSA